MVSCHFPKVTGNIYNPFNSLKDLVVVHGRVKAIQIYEGPTNKIFHSVNTMIGNVKRAIHGTYHSVGAKHLPRYLAEFCFRFNKRFIIGAMFNNLAKQAIQTKPNSQRLSKLAEN